VTFPLTAKVDVNGAKRHPLFDALTDATDSDGRAGDVEWNFEKFLVSPRGEVLDRFRPAVKPDDPRLVAAVEAALPKWKTVPARDVQLGDILRARGAVLAVTRIEDFGLGNGMLAFIEDTPERWAKRPAQADADVEILADRP
jgi:hypothetical protein